MHRGVGHQDMYCYKCELRFLVQSVIMACNTMGHIFLMGMCCMKDSCGGWKLNSFLGDGHQRFLKGEIWPRCVVPCQPPNNQVQKSGFQAGSFQA